MQSMHCTERIFLHTCAQWAHIYACSACCARWMCSLQPKCAQMQRASHQKTVCWWPEVYSVAPNISTKKIFNVECAEVQWGLYLESTLCIAATTKPKEALKSFQLGSFALLATPSVQYRRMSTGCGEGFTSIEPCSIQGKRGEVRTRKRRWCQESWQVLRQRSRLVWMVRVLCQIHYALMTGLLGRLLLCKN